MSPFPDGTETGGDIPYEGQFFDKGAMAYNVMHPDFGAKGDGAADDGPAWNLARASLPSAGGIILVPSGAYVLTTAFTFSSNTGVILLLLPGVVLSGANSTLPAPAGSNSIIDLRTNAVTTLANNSTPSVLGGHLFKTGGTTSITDFDDGLVGQELVILAEHSVTITDGAPIVLSGSSNYSMTTSDTLVLRMFNDQIWHEIARSVN